MNIPAAIRRIASAFLRERDEARRLVEVVRHGLRGIVKSQIPRMAAALAYRTLFSLIPVLVVGAVVMGAFLTDDELRSQLDRLIEYIGLDTIAVEEGGPQELAGPVMLEPLPSAQGIIGASGRLDEWITSLVSRVSGLPFKAIGFIGVLVLFYGAISMLVELERAFNQICGVTSGRSWTKRVTTYWTTLTLGLIFLLATFSVGDAAGNWVSSIGRGDGDSGGWLSRGLVEFGVNIVINTALLLLAYSTVPNVRVRVRAALAGAAIAGLGWELGKIAFTQYVQHAVGGLEQLYGVLALLPLFMFWVYITWVIVLFGLHIAIALQTFNARDAAEPGQARGIVDPNATVAIMLLAAARFRDGAVLTPAAVEEHTGIAADLAARLLSALSRAGLLRETDLPEGDPAFVLARPPELIPVPNLLAVARDARQGGHRGGAQPLDEVLDLAMQGVVLAQLQPTSDPADTSRREARPLPGAHKPEPA